LRTHRGKAGFSPELPWLTLLGLYAAWVVPMLLALPDAVALEKSILTTVASVRFPLFCGLLLASYQVSATPSAVQSRVLAGLGVFTAALLLLWCSDGLLQFATGSNLLGYNAAEGYINGFFGENENIKLGVSVAVLAPLALVHALRQWGRGYFAVLLLLIVLLVLLSGKRAAWIILGVEFAALFTYYLAKGLISARRVLGIVVLIAVAGGLAYSNSSWVQQRSDVLLQALDHPDYESLNKASNKRLPIWRTAISMCRAHWLNGVGPRGFRYAYAEYADADDNWATRLAGKGGSRASHAHQLLLELWSETGVLGLFGYLAFVGLLWRLWLRADAAARSRSLPFGISLLGWLFPVNTHPAWYSSWFSLLLWILVGLFLFALCEDKTPRESLQEFK
jgi:O-antigen ligase